MESETQRVDRIVCLAGQVFGNDQKAWLWLNSADERLANRTPLDVSKDKSGGHLVESILWQIDEGVYT